MKRQRTLRDFFGGSERSSYVGLEKVISGGQIGADQAALRAASSVGLDTGGMAPYQFMTAHGPDASLKSKFGLQESRWRGNPSASYVYRSKQNVSDADATIIFATHISTGTEKTLGYCRTGEWKVIPRKKKGRKKITNERNYRPHLIIETLHEKKLSQIEGLLTKFIMDHEVRILNVAGHRSDPRYTNFGDRIEKLLKDVFLRVKELSGTRLSKKEK